jgi:hypothetical protein
MDVVSYSRLPMDQQLVVCRRLMAIVESLPEFKHSRASGELISLWTGDGMALAFFGELTAPVHCARQILLALEPEDGFTVRMGIHTGPVYRMADIKRQPQRRGRRHQFRSTGHGLRRRRAHPDVKDHCRYAHTAQRLDNGASRSWRSRGQTR